MDILLMGDSKAGRTSMVKVVFQKIMFKYTKTLPETTRMETYDFRLAKIEFKLHDFPAKYDLAEAPPNEQMILKNASALIFVLSPQSDLVKVLDSFLLIHEYLKKRNTGNCGIFIFTNKADLELAQQDNRNEYQIKLKKKIGEEGISPHLIDFLFTSNTDLSIFEAFSKVIQKIISCSNSLSKILNHFAINCKVEKVYLFDLVTKLYIAHNDEKNIDLAKYEICSEMLDIFIDISYLYGGEKQGDDEDSGATVKLNLEEEDEILTLRVMEKYLALVFIVKDDNYDKPYVINENLKVFRRSINELLSSTLQALK